MHVRNVGPQMSKIPADLRYTKEHAWVRVVPGALVEVGVTDHGQETLGDLVSVELPPVGRRVTTGESFVTLESTKTAFEVGSPVSGEVTAVNTDLASAPEHINEDPYGSGWLVRLQVVGSVKSAALLDAAAYDALVKSESN
jgi:glycine cleavage system H protein